MASRISLILFRRASPRQGGRSGLVPGSHGTSAKVPRSVGAIIEIDHRHNERDNDPGMAAMHDREAIDAATPRQIAPAPSRRASRAARAHITRPEEGLPTSAAARAGKERPPGIQRDIGQGRARPRRRADAFNCHPFAPTARPASRERGSCRAWPSPLSGMAGTKTMRLGAWTAPLRARTMAISSAGSMHSPPRRTTMATTASPHRALGIPNCHATAVCDKRMLTQHRLPLSREDVESAGDDHVLLFGDRRSAGNFIGIAVAYGHIALYEANRR